MDKTVRKELIAEHRRIHMRLWTIECYDKIGADIDEEEFARLQGQAASLEMLLRLPPRKANLV